MTNIEWLENWLENYGSCDDKAVRLRSIRDQLHTQHEEAIRNSDRRFVLSERVRELEATIDALTDLLARSRQGRAS